VIEGVRHGLTNPDIASRLGLSLDAVKFHVTSALGKLGMTSRKELQQWSGVRADSALAAAGPAAGVCGWSLGQVARATSNLPAMADWLRDTVGLTEIMRFETAAFFACGDVRLYLSVGDPANNSMLYFRVADIVAAVEDLRAKGVTIKSAPHRIHVHDDGTEEWMAFFTDPDGGHLGLMSMVPCFKGDAS
jgi:catechol 2,3-dioxygenase-like lactoylglutathione lyase family enzyme